MNNQDTMKSRAPVAVHKPVTFGEWLARKDKAKKDRRARMRIRKVSPKRAKENRKYTLARLRYLSEHPYCQIFIRRHGLDEYYVFRNGGVVYSRGYWLAVPKATEIHHSKKPKCKYLLDESTWFSCCREQHEWVENHKSEARQLGLLQNN